MVVAEKTTTLINNIWKLFSTYSGQYAEATLNARRTPDTNNLDRECPLELFKLIILYEREKMTSRINKDFTT